jgi:hypothetical protein
LADLDLNHQPNSLGPELGTFKPRVAAAFSINGKVAVTKMVDSTGKGFGQKHFAIDLV